MLDKLLQAGDGILGVLASREKLSDVLTATNRIAGTLFDKERLERGESTSNISVVSRMVDASVSSLHKRVEKAQELHGDARNVNLLGQQNHSQDAGNREPGPASPESSEGVPGGMGEPRDDE